MKRREPLLQRAFPIMRALLLCASLLPFTIASASHLSGGEITWSWVSGNQYRVRLTLFRDCAGSPMQPTAPVHVVGSNLNYTVDFQLESSSEVTQLCPSLMPSSACNGGTLPGLQRYTYARNLPFAPGHLWTLTYTEVFRNAAIMNLVSPDNLANRIHASINTALAPGNSSPQFSNTPIPYVCIGQPVQYSYGAYDSNGDSLGYELISALGTNGAALPYLWPHAALNPIPGIQLNSATGELSFTPQLAGNWVVVVKVTQYNSSGQAMGYAIRDMQFVVYPCANDQPDPNTGLIEDLTGACMLSGPRAIELCQSGSFCFNIQVADPNAGDVLTAMSNVEANLPGATFSWTTGNPATGTICWTAQPGLTGLFPFIVQVSDGNCPLPAEQTYVYAVNVSEWLQAGIAVVDESCAGLGNGSASVTVASGLEPYSYQWSTGATGQSMAGSAGTYSLVLTDATDCTTQTIPFTIGTSLPATATAGPDLTVCAGVTAIPLNGEVDGAPLGTWSGGSGSFTGQWPNVSYNPSAADLAQGSVTLTLSATSGGGCPPATDALQIVFGGGSAGAVSVSPVTCAGAANGMAQYAPDAPGLNYAWNDPAQQAGPIATGLAAGAYVLTITDAAGCTQTIPVQVSEPAPLVLASIAIAPETCDGPGSLAPQVNGGTPPYSYAWSNGSEGAVLLGSGGDYSVSISDAAGCAPVTAQATIPSDGLPGEADAGPDQFVCATALPVVLQGAVANATDASWSGGGGVFAGAGLSVSYSPSSAEIAAGEVTLYLTAMSVGACPPGIDSVTIQISPALNGLSLAITPVTCAGAANGVATVQPQLAGLSYEWIGLPGQTAATVTGLSGGIWEVQVSGAAGCDTTLFANIEEPPFLDVFIAAFDASCFGDSNGVATAMIDGGTPDYSILWSNGQIAPSLSMLPAGPIGLTVTDAQGCTATAEAVIGQASPITAWITAPDTVCAGAPFEVVANAEGGSSNYVFSWQGYGSGDSITLSLNATQTIVMQAQDAFGCPAAPVTATISVLNLNNASLSLTDDTLVCPGSTIVLSAQVLGYPGEVSISWPELGASGNGPHALLALADTVIHVVATDACGAQLLDSVLVSVDQLPVIDWPAVIGEGCAPFTMQLQPPAGTNGMSFQWNLGVAGLSNEPAPTAQFPAGEHVIALIITTVNGCAMAAPVQSNVVVHQPPDAAFDASAWSLYASQAEAAFTDASSGAVSTWHWDFGDGSSSGEQDPVHWYHAAGNYPVTFTVADAFGCTDAITRFIEVLADHQIAIPNAFTPNPAGPNGGQWNRNDLSNDVFFPLVSDVSDYELLIFNRWGEVLFESQDPAIGWDGYHRGRLSPADGYVYRISATFNDGQRLSRTGPFTLIR